jgi:hypothetical protein
MIHLALQVLAFLYDLWSKALALLLVRAKERDSGRGNLDWVNSLLVVIHNSSSRTKMISGRV